VKKFIGNSNPFISTREKFLKRRPLSLDVNGEHVHMNITPELLMKETKLFV